jgi:hypothetical protein
MCCSHNSVMEILKIYYWKCEIPINLEMFTEWQWKIMYAIYFNWKPEKKTSLNVVWYKFLFIYDLFTDNVNTSVYIALNGKVRWE